MSYLRFGIAADSQTIIIAQQHHSGCAAGHQFVEHRLSRLCIAHGFAVDGKDHIA